MTWAYVAIGGGTAIAGEAGKKASKKGNSAANLQADISNRLFTESDPLRRSLIGRSGGFLGGGTDVTSTPTFMAFKDTADRTFGRAKDNTLATLPAGGALNSALVGLEGNRASTLTQGAGSIYNDELARAMTLATGQTGTAISGLGQAANAQALNAQAAAQQSSAKSGALGTGVGAYMGSKNTGTGTKPASTKG